MRFNDRNVLETTRMNRKKLIDIVQENMAKHVSDYTEAVAEWKVAQVKVAQENRTKAGKNVKLAETGNYSKFLAMTSWLPEPQSYEKSYSKALRMLELSVDDTIEIPADTFNQLVLDEWEWKQNFVTTSMATKAYIGR